MSNPESHSNSTPAAPASNPIIWVLMGMALLVISGAVGFFSFAPKADPPPPEVLNDPFLMEGRSVYLTRCVTCHGLSGKGDGPMAASFGGEQIGDLADGKWKHGDKAEDVLRVIRVGVPGTRMAPWGPLLEDDQIRAVAAYCYILSQLPVPEMLRETNPEPSIEPR